MKCDSYDDTVVRSALVRAVDLLGGIGQFVTRGKKLLLKPNVLFGTDPAQCVITHPSVFKAATELFQSAGMIVSYGDSPAGLQNALHSMKKSTYHQTAQELSVALDDFDHGRYVSFKGGIQSKQLYIADAVLNADTVISLPKLKTHGLVRMTGAIKNQYGCVPGVIKGQYHAQYPDVYDFSNFLADITAFIRPRLYIMDAVFAMEGNGPQSGTPKKIGALLVSSDPVALDATACRIIDLDPSFVPTIASGIRANLGTSDPCEIELLGDPLESFIDKEFDVTRLPCSHLPTNGLIRKVRSMLVPSPKIIKKKCTRCGRCIEMCPVNPKAVNWHKGSRKQPPRYNYDECIRCFCCQEMCPSKAIVVHHPFLRKLLPVATYIGLFISRSTARHKKKERCR